MTATTLELLCAFGLLAHRHATQLRFELLHEHEKIGVAGGAKRMYYARQFSFPLGTQNNISDAVFRKEKRH